MMFRHLYQNWLMPLLKWLKLKRHEPVPLNCGILIIGSLLWDAQKGRPAWRSERLDLARAQTVTAPIRYGRLSGSRGNSYTMVFSRLCPVGRAKLIPCSHTILSAADLIAEAEWLWKAEQPDAKPHRIAAKWGCVAPLCNPARNIPDHLLKGWEELVRREPNYGQVSQTKEEGDLVEPNGLLRIEWPRLVDRNAPADLDLLIVTATDPEIFASSPA